MPVFYRLNQPMPKPLAKKVKLILLLNVKKLDDVDACWEWMGALDRDGYGRFYAQKNMAGGLFLAHRATYVLAYGLIPLDKPCVLHDCDNPRCCNPKHLKAGTNLDNIEARQLRQRNARGEFAGGAKLWPEAIQAIRREYKWNSSTHGSTALAKKYGVTQHLIQLIIKRKAWKHIK